MDENITHKVSAILSDLVALQRDTADEEVPGWIIGKPTLSELNSDLAFVAARSKPDEHAPLYLPDDAEAAIAVMEGSIRVDSGQQSVVLMGRRFTVVTSGPGRTIIALEPLTRVHCIYFRDQAGGNGQLATASQ